MSQPRDLILAQCAGGEMTPLKGYAGAFVRPLSISEVDKVAEHEGKQGLMMIALAVVDKDGAPIFSEADVEQLAKLKVGAFRSIMRQINEVNSLDADAPEELAKN